MTLLTHKDLSLPEETGLDGIDKSNDPFVNLEQIFEPDLTRRSVNQRLINVLEGSVEAEDLVVLNNALPANSELCLQDRSGIKI